ncbi:MAG: hypothetical protein WC457_03870 [Patescibacteria group bacterium]
MRRNFLTYLKNKLFFEKAIIFACLGVFIAVFVYGWPVWSDTRSAASNIPWYQDNSLVGIVTASLFAPDESAMDSISLSRKLAASPLRDKYRQEGSAFVLPAKEIDGVAYKIGAPEGDSFSPAITIERWDGEASMKIIPKFEGEISGNTLVETKAPAEVLGVKVEAEVATSSGIILTPETGDDTVTGDSGITTTTADTVLSEETVLTDTTVVDTPTNTPSEDVVSITQYSQGEEAIFANFSTILNEPLSDSSVSTEKALFIDRDELGEEKVIKYETSHRQYIFYDKTVTIPNEKYSDGMSENVDGYEFEFALKTKPSTNVFEFDIATENLEFFYQPPLNVEMSDPSCSPTECHEYHRPINVVGSYAVYYKGGLQGDYSAMGGKNYGTGMAFSIYRPQAFDASGRYTWCELNIDEVSGKMTITVPQYFLDEAVYPVIVDPTFGNTTAGTSYTSSINGRMVGSKFDSGSGAAGATVVTTTAYMYPDSGYYAGYGIYNSSYNLVANSASTAVGTTKAWYAYKLSTSPTISSSTYWLLKNDNDSQNYFYYTTGATNQSLSKTQTYGTWPSSFTSPTLGALKYSIYATYNASSNNVTVGTTGNQTATMVVSSTNNYVGGAFYIVGDATSRNVTGISINEIGTVDAQNNLDNIKLYYELDTVTPYDCASVSYNGTETQYGSTDTDGFSASNGTSTFSGTVAVTSAQAMCVYAVVDVGSGAGEGQTIEIQITNPSTAVTISSGAVGPSSAVAITGSTALVSSVTVGTGGSQATGMTIPSTDNYVGGYFSIIENAGSRNVTGISIFENGTVDAQTDLDNIKLYYDLDATTPYDCASESYGGTETQFGSTDTDGFSAANGTSTFSGSVGISTTSAMCVYTVLDVASGATLGETLEIQISDPSTGVTVSSGTTGPSSTVAISGSTVFALPTISGSIGKTSDGWSGAIPVNMTLNGLSYLDYPYARASTTNSVGDNLYTNLTWDAIDGRYEGVIYPGSNFCNGCADPNTGTFRTTLQLSSSSNFSSIDYSTTTANFTTYITRRWNAISTAAMGNGAEFNPTWSVDHWNYEVADFSVNAAATYSNVAIAFPFHPTTSDINITSVSLAGTALSEGTAASTTDCWWWDSGHHTLYIQDNSMGTTYKTVAFSFTSDTDLFATRYDRLYTYNIGERLFYNGLVFANQFINTPMFGGGYEGAGEQVEMSCRNSSDNDVNLDCMERTAVVVNDTVRIDSSGYYAGDIKWKQDEWANYIVSEDDNSITTLVHSDGAANGWAQQLATGIDAYRYQTFYASKRYLKNVYTFTNASSTAYDYPLVWGREQWLGTDRNTNDKGWVAGETTSSTVERQITMSSLTKKWFTTYDTGIWAAMGVIFDQDDPATYGYYFQHSPVSSTIEWPLQVAVKSTNEADDIYFVRRWDDLPAGASTTFTFWQWGYCTTSLNAITTTIDKDYDEVNSVTPVVSVTVSDGVVSYGTIAENSSVSTIDLGDLQTITNNGNVTEDFAIKGQDGSGGGCTWTLATSNGADQYVHRFCNDTDLDCSSPPTNYTAMTTTYQNIDTNVAADGTTQFQLRLTAPSASTCYGEQDVDVTLLATQS